MARTQGGGELLVLCNQINAVRLARAMKEMYTPHVKLLLVIYEPPEALPPVAFPDLI